VRADDGGYGWALRLWLVVLGFGAITLWRSAVVGIPLRDPGGEILRSRIAITVVLALVLAVADAARRTPRPGWSWRAARATLRARWTRQRVVLAVLGLLAYHLVYFCYHNLKSWDAFNTVRDDRLTRVDRWLFLGHPPAVLLHDLLGQHLANGVLVAFYESFATVVTVSFVAAVVLMARMREAYVVLASMVWVWILGVGCYYLIPSLGPFHARPQDFAGLPRGIVSDTQDAYMAQRAHLLAHPGASDAFAQVSAFASLHVGVTCVLVLLLRLYAPTWVTRLGACYLGVTIVATVYLGWHFAVDDVAGLAIGALAVLLGTRTVRPHGRAAPAPSRVDGVDTMSR
jgi:hypothetical protein